ncbi:MAG: diguanylate cyclase, partial [Candidatus Eremiobacteraeota bacterium]|nr:diguanylate cyclase [Candidatus Eremiobacteraeota bacterium]
RRDLPFKWLFAMFGTFIAACSTTHLLAIWTIWHPDYWVDGGIKAFTAAISLLTAVVFIGIVPKALALRSAQELEEANSRLESANAETQALIEHLGDGIAVFDENLTVIRQNKAAERLMAIQAANGKMVDGDDVDIPPERWPSALARATGEAQSALVGFGPEKGRRWAAVSAMPLKSAGAATGVHRIVLSARDVTELKERETELRDYARQLHALHKIAGMKTIHRKEQIDAALLVGLAPLGLERAFFVKLDVSTNEFVVESSVASGDWNPLVVGERYSLRDTLIGRAIEGKDILAVTDVDAEAKSLGPRSYGGGGSYLAVPINVEGSAYGAIGFVGRGRRTAPFTKEQTEFAKLAGDLISSALERASQSERLDSLAFFDALTGLPNRVLLYDRLVQTILASQRRGERFAVLFLDLDGFKEVNDLFGHAAGDAVLKVVATRLKDALRDSDTVARLGGDEFVIIGAGIKTMSDASIFADRVLETMRRPIDDGERMHHLSASIGVSFYPIDGVEMNTLIEQADVALYEAKHSGKNKVHFATADVAPAIVH